MDESMRTMRRACAAALFIWMIAACDDPGNDKAQIPSVATPTPANIVGPEGGTIQVPNLVTLVIPPNAFSTPTTIQISRIPTPTGDIDLIEAASLFGLREFSPDAVHVSIGSRQPAVSLGVIFAASNDYLQPPAGMVARVFVAIENESAEEEAYPTWELLPVTRDLSNATLAFDARPSMFARRNPDGTFTGTFILTRSPGRI